MNAGLIPFLPQGVAATMPGSVGFICAAANIHLTQWVLLCDKTLIFKIMSVFYTDQQCASRHAGE